MAYFGGNAFHLPSGAAYNSTNNLAGGFPLVGRNTMRPNGGAYGSTTYGGPMNGGAPLAQSQPISMGSYGLPQPMPVGMTTGQYMRHPVAQYLAVQGIPMATGPHYAPMPHGTYPHVPGTYHPAMQGLSMANAPLNAPMAYGMRPEGAYGHGALAGSLGGPHAFSEQRPAPLVPSRAENVRAAQNSLLRMRAAPVPAPQVAVPAGPTRAQNMRGARNALLRMRAAAVPAPQAAAPSEAIDLTQDSDDEPIAISSTPVTQRANNKKRSADSTPLTAGKPAKKPRYSRFMGGSALPTPPVSSPAVSSSGSSVSPVVLPATPSSVSPTPAPRKKRADLSYLLGSVHRNFLAQPVNARLAGPEAESVVESIETTVARSSTASAPLPARPEDTNSESDADFEVDDEYVVPAADAATDDAEQSDELVIDENGNVLVDAKGRPLERSMWLAQQAAAHQSQELELVETSSAASERAAMLERLNASALAAAETSRQVAESVAAAQGSTSRTTKSKRAAAPKKTAAPKKKALSGSQEAAIFGAQEIGCQRAQEAQPVSCRRR
jgi:hypothetical protein